MIHHCSFHDSACETSSLTCMTGPGSCRLAVSSPLWKPSAVMQNFLKHSDAFRGHSPQDLPVQKQIA